MRINVSIKAEVDYVIPDSDIGCHKEEDVMLFLSDGTLRLIFDEGICLINKDQILKAIKFLELIENKREEG